MSLYRRLHEVQQAPTAPGGAAGRDPVLDDLRHKIHQRLIEELGPILYDSRLAPEDLQEGARAAPRRAWHKNAHRCPRTTRRS